MFTGLIEELGRVASIQQSGENLYIKIEASKIIQMGKIGDSIAVNGVCLTAVEMTANGFSADVMPESWKRSRLKDLKTGDSVNLEKSVTPSTPLGGHLVYGDVDTVAVIDSVTKEGIATIYSFKVDPHWMRYIALKGRVAIDGASLTVMQRSSDTFSVSLIPHSACNLILGKMKSGDKINLETDVMAKYCETLLGGNPNLTDANTKSGLSWDKLAENGFL